MIPVRIIISILVINTVTCLARISIEPLNPEQTSIFAKTTAQVLTLCYKNKLNTVGIAGNSVGLLIRTLHAHELPTVTLLGNTSKRISEIGHERRRGLPRKLRVFVVAASSATELHEILKDIKHSTWWNHSALYLILDLTSGSKRGCSNAFEMLWIAWAMDLLEAKYVCFNRTMDQSIYSYNPYTKHAPNPWTLVNTYRGFNDHPFSLFVRRYHGNGSICKELDFVKANDLGGYRIYASAIKTLRYCPGSNITLTNCSDMSYEVSNLILSETLGGVIYTKRHRNAPLKRPNMTIKGVLSEVKSGITDILLDTRFRSVVANYTTTYPHWRSGLSVLTQRSPQKSSIRKILSLVDGASRFGFNVVLIITLIYFQYFVRQDLVHGFLDTILVICNMPLKSLPRKMAPRIYLGSLLMFVITIQAVYQGNLASLLTMPVSFPNVETLQDLVTLNYTIYSHKSYGQFFRYLGLQERYHGNNYYNCTDEVLRDPLAACVRGERYLIPEMMRFGLHMSNTEIIELNEVFVIRDDWPIEPKVNEVIMRMGETGLALHLNSKQTDVSLDKHDFFEELLKTKKFRIITLSNLTFAFAILGIGLSCATVAFIIEVGMVFT